MKKLAVALCVLYAVAGFAAEKLPATKTPPLPQERFTKEFRQISPFDLSGNVFKRIIKDNYLITAGTAQGYNSMTAGWGGFGILYSKPVATIYVNENRYTDEFLKSSNFFTLSFYEGKDREKLYSVFGSKSGRDIDKEKASLFLPVSTPGGGVSYMQARTVIVCKKIATVKLTDNILLPGVKPENMKEQIHNAYIGEIIGVWVR
ncbi:MAG: flavin reductase family protein [Victivallales bacterium]|jgi:flavin reductase (DIM6/NTAB) family NADH-FMN oxidoreductase RutF|nr:flavin reductase family protein [Victivallales bacterium]